jgi:hypothetical protein
MTEEFTTAPRLTGVPGIKIVRRAILDFFAGGELLAASGPWALPTK